MDELVLVIEGGVFNNLRNDINAVLRNTIYTMLQKGGEKAELKVSLRILLDTEDDITKPTFEHRVSSVLQYKTERDGFILEPDMELAWDGEKGEYVLAPIQDSLFD
jgi:hypothetical protein